MKSGCFPVRVRTTAPIVSPLSTSGWWAPFSSASGALRPQSRVLPTPIVGRWSHRPRWLAMPMRRGWAMPMPSNRNTSGSASRRPNASSSTGPSRKLSRPGT